MANLAISQNALSTAAEVIGVTNGRRVRLTILNADASIVVYLGADSGVTSGNGFPLAGGASFTFEGFSAAGEVYGIAASGTPTVALIEEYS